MQDLVNQGSEILHKGDYLQDIDDSAKSNKAKGSIEKTYQ